MGGGAQAAADAVAHNGGFAEFFGHGQAEFDLIAGIGGRHQDDARRDPFLAAILHTQKLSALAEPRGLADGFFGGFFHAFYRFFQKQSGRYGGARLQSLFR